ncbi:MAG: CBS domain-containing protein, partial [Chloroflexi bacterium]|nr:CBS domain-containing protein [Chloroflexota bacterium]
MTDLAIANWMTTDVVTVHLDTTLPEAHELMTKHKIRRLPVVNDARELVGMVTLGDLREARPSSATSLNVWELNYLLAKLRISDFMSRTLITIAPETSVVEAARLMLAHKISGLPVVDAHGTLCGIITETDLFRVMVEKLGAK